MSVGPTVSENDDGDDQAVETQNTCQDDRDDRLDDEIRLQHRDRANSEAGLGSSVGSAEVWSDRRLLQKMRAAAMPMYPKKAVWSFETSVTAAMSIFS
jgi:hypothetical protein